MKTTSISVAFLVIVPCVCLVLVPVSAAPAPQDQQPNVQFVKYSNDQELEEIQRQIIAQFDHLGGSSQFHDVKGTSYVDPNNIQINV